MSRLSSLLREKGETILKFQEASEDSGIKKQNGRINRHWKKT